MTTQTMTCTCGGEIRPSYIATTPINVLSPKGEITYPAACQGCGKTYADVVSVPMTLADLAMVGDRLSKSTRQDLEATATELTQGCYQVEIPEDRARDLASKVANLGLVPLANKVRQELDGLTSQRRQR
jgi:hypothetical protein